MKYPIGTKVRHKHEKIGYEWMVIKYVGDAVHLILLKLPKDYIGWLSPGYLDSSRTEKLLDDMFIKLNTRKCNKPEWF